MSDYILTYSGAKVTPLEPNPDQINITDIAHALSLLPRANGHLKYFYSVAQHSLSCAVEAEARGYSKKVCLACLIHDASEAYLSDIVRPIKVVLTNYLEVEKLLQESIYKKYLPEPLTDDEREQIKSVDDAILYYEFLNISGVEIQEFVPEIFGAHDFSHEPTRLIEEKFKERFGELSG